MLPARRQSRARARAAPTQAQTAHSTAAQSPAADVANVHTTRNSALGNRAREALFARLRANAREQQEQHRRTTANNHEPTPEQASATEQESVSLPTIQEPRGDSASSTPQAIVVGDTQAAQETEAVDGLQQRQQQDLIARLQEAQNTQSEETASAGTAEAPQPPVNESATEISAAGEQSETSSDTTPAGQTPSGDHATELAPGPAMDNWRARAAQAGNAVENPGLTQTADAAAGVRDRGVELRLSRTARRESITPEAQEAVGSPPEAAEAPLAPPEDPKPEANALVDEHDHYELSTVTMPELVLTPHGTQPRVIDPRRETPPSATESAAATSAQQIATDPTAQEPTTEDQASIDEITAAANAPTPDVEPGTAEPAQIEHEALPARQPLEGGFLALMREAIARLLIDTEARARPIIVKAREDAYPQKVLPHVYDEIGDDQLDRVTAQLSEALHKVAADAGVEATALEASVQQQRVELAGEADTAESELNQAGTEETQELQEASGEEVAEVEAAEDALELQTTAVVEAASGEGSPELINRRRDDQIRRINRRVSDLRFGYSQAQTHRHQELDRQKLLQYAAYDRAVLQDIETLEANAPEGESISVVDRLAIGALRIWTPTPKREVATAVEQLKSAATTETAGFRADVTEAGNTANDMVRDWAEDAKGETSNFWSRLLASYLDWSEQADHESDQWATVRAGEARDASVENAGMLGRFISTQGESVNLEENEIFERLNDEQKAVIRAYYDSPPENRDGVGAVAAGLAHRLAANEQSNLIARMQSEVMDKGVQEAYNLQQIGNAQSEFSAVTISDNLYEAMHGGITGLGTDEEKIYRNLSGLTRLQGHAVRMMYEREHGINLDSDLASELDEDNAAVRARAALNGDVVLEAVAALHEAMDGVGTDEDTIMRMLRGKTAEQRAAITAEYKRRYRVDLEQELDDEMDDHEQERAEALLSGNTARADAIALDEAMNGGFLSWGTDEEAIEAVYVDIRADAGKMNDEQGNPLTQEALEQEITRRAAEVEYEYNDEYGTPGQEGSALRDEFRDELSGPDLDLVNALADNDMVRADAARLRREQLGFYADDDVINGVLENQYQREVERLRRTPELRAARAAIQEQAAAEGWNHYQIAEAERQLERKLEQDARIGAAQNMADLEDTFDQEYSRWGSGGVQALIEFNMSGTDREKARLLVEQGGYLTPAERIDFATRGPGTDEEEFKRAIAGRTAAEIAKIDADLARLGRPSASAIADEELTGREHFDMSVSLEGVPENEHQEMAQARRRAEWEINNSPVGGHERSVLERRLAEMQEQYDLIHDADADPFERERALRQFHSRGQGVQSGVTLYRSYVDSVTDAAATAAALAVAITVTVLTGGVAGAVLGALYAAATTMAVKGALKGAAYGGEEMALDAVVGIVDAAAAYATFGMANVLMRVATSGVSARVSRLGTTRLAAALTKVAGQQFPNTKNDGSWCGRNGRRSCWRCPCRAFRQYSERSELGARKSPDQHSGRYVNGDRHGRRHGWRDRFRRRDSLYPELIPRLPEPVTFWPIEALLKTGSSPGEHTRRKIRMPA